MRLPSIISPIAFALLGLWLPAAAAADTPGLREVVDAAARRMMAEHDVPGMAIAVTVDGRSSVFSYGIASKANKAPVTENTLFEIGSVSKTFTATLATYAEALGKLSLDDRPSRHLPQLQGSAIDAASLLHLGTYTAGGLPLQVPAEVSSDAAMVNYLRRWKPDAPPGTTRRYSNPSIGLMGRLTAMALDGDFARAMEARLLPELGLGSSYVRVPEAAQAAYAWGYDNTGKPVRVNPGVFEPEAYGIKSTAADMIRFVQSNLEPSRHGGPLRRAIEGTQVGYFAVGAMVQGLGWEQYPYPVALARLLEGNSTPMVMGSNPAVRLAPPRPPSGPTLFNKTGSTNGFGAYAAFVPERKIGLVILANRNLPVPARLRAAHAILERLDAGSR
jgi:beta-lactamase class C